MAKIKKLHFKDLNTLRFIAFIPVFLFLCLSLIQNDKSTIFSTTYDNVKLITLSSFDFFFFLSAFLITSLGLREYKYRKTFSLKNFYIRKVFRIIPLLLILFVFAFYFHSKIIDILKLTIIPKNDITPYLFGIPNFIADINKERFSYTVVLWVIFMFIQFYFILGLILKYFKNQLVLIGLTCLTIGIFTRFFYIIYDINFEFNPLSYGVSIGIGILLAYYLRLNNTLAEHVKKLNKGKITAFYLIGSIGIVLIYPLTDGSIFTTLAPLFTTLFFSFIIIEQTYAKKSIIKFRKFKLMSQLGKISYGFLIYTSIISTILIILFESLDRNLDSMFYKIIFILSTFVISGVSANTSYNSIEKLFNRIKRDFKKV